MIGSIGRGAGIGALSNGVSNMCVTTIDCLMQNTEILMVHWMTSLYQDFSGVVSGGRRNYRRFYS